MEKNYRKTIDIYIKKQYYIYEKMLNFVEEERNINVY